MRKRDLGTNLACRWRLPASAISAPTRQPNSLFALDGRYIGGTGRLESASATTPARPVCHVHPPPLVRTIRRRALRHAPS